MQATKQRRQNQASSEMLLPGKKMENVTQESESAEDYKIFLLKAKQSIRKRGKLETKSDQLLSILQYGSEYQMLSDEVESCDHKDIVLQKNTDNTIEVICEQRGSFKEDGNEKDDS